MPFLKVHLRFFDSICFDFRFRISYQDSAFLIHEMNRKKRFVSNNSTIDFRAFQYILKFLKIDNIHLIWLYAFQMITCKFSVGAFNLLYSKLLLAKLRLFVSGATFAAYFIAYVAALFVAIVVKDIVIMNPCSRCEDRGMKIS